MPQIRIYYKFKNHLITIFPLNNPPILHCSLQTHTHTHTPQNNNLRFQLKLSAIIAISNSQQPTKPKGYPVSTSFVYLNPFLVINRLRHQQPLESVVLYQQITNQMQPSCSSELSQGELSHLYDLFGEVLRYGEQAKFNDFCSHNIYFTQQLYRKVTKQGLGLKIEEKDPRSRNKKPIRRSALRKLEEVRKKNGNKLKKPGKIDNKLTYESSYESSSSYYINTMPAFAGPELTIESSPIQTNAQQVEVLEMPEQLQSEMSQEQVKEITQQFDSLTVSQQHPKPEEMRQNQQENELICEESRQEKPSLQFLSSNL